MTAKIWNYSEWTAETNPQKLRETFDRILRECGFKILGTNEHHFQPQGYTVLWLLGESHFAIHTFPEFEKSYFELSSCNQEYYIKFIEQTKDMQ